VSAPQGSDGLQLEEDARFQLRLWLAERIGWGVMAIVLAAAAFGFFGHGPVSRATVRLCDRVDALCLAVDYERFSRIHHASTLQFSSEKSTADGALSLWLPNEYLADVDVEQVTPNPDHQEITAGGVRYHFAMRDGKPVVIFQFKAHRAGPLSGSLRLNDGPAVSFRQFIYP